jgi:hypothetical protein
VSEKKEYIERGALLKAFGCENAVKYGNKNAEQQHKSYSSMMLYEIADEINDSPAADVAEVVHGEWETDRDTIRCSVCGFGYFPNGYFFKDGQCIGGLIFDRCPNCGAKMDGEKEGV